MEPNLLFPTTPEFRSKIEEMIHLKNEMGVKLIDDENSKDDHNHPM